MDLGKKFEELSGDEFLHQLIAKWTEKQFKDEELYTSLFKVSNHYTSSELFYIKYFEPLTFIVSLALIVIVFIVFKRGDALKPVQVLLLVTCSIDVLAILLLFPFDMIFAYFVDIDAPVPAPICSIFMYISMHVVGCLLSIAQTAKIILSINRVISIRYPIKAKIWLTSWNMIKICIITAIGVVCMYIPLNFHAISIKYETLYGKFWTTEEMHPYEACALADMSNSRDLRIDFAFSVSYTVILRILPLLVLFVCIVLLVVFLRKTSEKQKRLNSSNKKLYKLSKITTIMLINFAILEIPQIAATCLYLYMTPAFVTLTGDPMPLSRELIAAVRTTYKVTFGVSSSINMMVYAVMSKKFRLDLYSMLRCQQVKK